MIHLLAVAAGLAASPGRPPAVPPVPAADVARARDIVRRLGSADFREREEATRQLRAMGRLALPALADAATADPDPEVRGRCDLLIPPAEADDLSARLAAFRADADGKFDHALPGWDVFRASAGSDALSRELFAELFKAPGNRDLMAGFAAGKDELARREADRKLALRTAVFPQNGVGVRTGPTLADVVGLLLAESELPGDNPNRGGLSVINLLFQPSTKTEFQTGKFKDPAARVLTRWLDTRTGANGLATAVSVVTTLELKSGVKYAVKALTADGTQPHTRAMAAAAVGKLGGKDQLADLAKAFGDEGVVRGVPNGTNVQVRDIALAMSAVLAGKPPTDLGLRLQSPDPTARFYYWNYSFATAEDREKGFAKWKEAAPK